MSDVNGHALGAPKVGLNYRLENAMARTTKTPKPSVSTEAVAASAAPIFAMGNDAAAQMGLDAARSILSASLNASQALLKFMEQVQEVQAQAFRNMEGTLSAAITDANQAASLQDLAALNSKLMQANLAGTAENFSSLLTRWCDAEAQFFEQAQAQTADLTRKVVQESAPGAQSEGADKAANSALELLSNAQSAWTQLTQQWVDAVKDSSTRH
ncbi:MAG TPA: hypothetical protein VJ608_08050 [Albitalea sp.]|nr:hypothetical protein [Albitalea sp.]